MKLTKMYEFDALKRISAYVSESRLKESLKAEIPHMVVKANELEVLSNPFEMPQPAGVEDCGLKSQGLIAYTMMRM